MNKRFIIVIGVLLSIAGISLAAVLSNYGRVVGTANIAGPEFYIGSAGTEETLLINRKSPNCEPFEIGNEYRTFKTKDLGGIDFNYIPKAKFSVRAKVATTTPQDLILSWGYFDTSDVGEINPHYLCTATISLTLTENMTNYTSDFIECFSKPTDVKRFFYEFRKDADCLTCGYTISKCVGGFYTKIELSK